MKTGWIIQCVGVTEEDQAHLRLLLRSARKQMREDWVWGLDAAHGGANVAGARMSGATSEADLLLMGRRGPVDDTTKASLPDGQRASQAGVASAQLIDADEPAPAGLFLRRPFHRDAFAALLNEVARSVAESAATSDQAEAAHEVVAPLAAQAGPTAHDAQNLPRAEDDPHPPSSKATEPTADENAMHALLRYLPKRMLGGPAQIALPGAPPLVIDPEARMFWADGLLPTLEPYAREPLRFGDWKHLGGAELEDACKSTVARPFAYLIWMDSFIHSRGILSRRFDPEGTYCLSKRLDLANDYPRALRISAQMNQPRRLDAIARASGADLAEVFDVVNAYEAIGYLEWTRHGEVPPCRS